jgi:hypothetical protein
MSTVQYMTQWTLIQLWIMALFPLLLRRATRCCLLFYYLTCKLVTVQGHFFTIGCSSTTFSAQLTACLRDFKRDFKTDPTEAVTIVSSTSLSPSGRGDTQYLKRCWGPHLVSRQSIIWLDGTVCKTEGYCLSRFCFEITGHEAVDEHRTCLQAIWTG